MRVENAAGRVRAMVSPVASGEESVRETVRSVTLLTVRSVSAQFADRVPEEKPMERGGERVRQSE